MIDKMDLSNKASNLRKKLGEDALSPIDIFKSVQAIDKLTLVFYSLGKNISGVCYKGKASHVIAINAEMSVGNKNTISLITIGKGDESERKADQFASYFLIPSSSLYELVEAIKAKESKRQLSVEDVIKLEQYYGVSHKAMLYRLVNDGYLQQEQGKAMETGVIELAAKLGYDTALYRPSATKDTTLGYYITASEKLLELERISQGKYEELLLDAFREDIVYGVGGEEEMPLD